jgi:TolA-binding protein
MHFQPESLKNFTLVYENEHYRLFRVVNKMETVFITDHPPTYQQEVLALAGNNLEAFRQRTNELLLTYNGAMRDIDAGKLKLALRKLSWCVQQAPHYTLARVALGRTLTQMGELEQARTTLANVIAYAPDNPDALYQMAYVLAELDQTDQARNYLQILYTTTTDPRRLDKARLLEAFIEQGIPVSP